MAEVQLRKFVVSVNFIHGLNGLNSTHKDYDFHCNLPIQDGDVVVVDTVHGLQLAKVIGVKKSSSSATKWVVDKVDLAEHQQRIEFERKRAELEREMEKRAKQADKLERYRALAQNDPQMAKMLQEYEQLEQEFAWESLPGK